MRSRHIIGLFGVALSIMNIGFRVDSSGFLAGKRLSRDYDTKNASYPIRYESMLNNAQHINLPPDMGEEQSVSIYLV
jgi:hypothetical protein